MKPICYDLYCGLGGWAEGFLAECYDVVGYDIKAHDYGTGGYPGILKLRDVRSIHGSELKDATCIVASPPCQGYSYRAMPWKRAKALPPPDNELFNACFRIQREASEAAGHYIPLIVENVCGAQKWVGPAPAHYGSYYLWGDVGQVGNKIVAGDVRLGAFVKASQRASKNNGGSWFAVAHNTTSGHSQNPDGRKVPGHKWSDGGIYEPMARLIRQGLKGIPHSPTGHWTNPVENGTKQPGIGGTRKNGKGDGWFQDGAARHGSKSDSRKAASAMIAKIPFPLAVHIARCFRPVTERGTVNAAAGSLAMQQVVEGERK